MTPDTAKMALRNGVVERKTVGVDLVEVGSIILYFCAFDISQQQSVWQSV
jgi:hypothetical protein